MEKIRILHVVSNMQQGGIENFIMNIYRNIDRDLIQFDFMVHYKSKFYFDDEIEQLGGKIYRLSFMEDKNIFKYLKDLDSFFKENSSKYDIVHAHMGSLGGIYLYYAKKYNIPIRIAHSHGASHLNTLKGYSKFLLNKRFKHNANNLWACSTEAGIYMFGKYRKFEFIPNTVDYNKFYYNLKARKEIRKKYNIDDSTFLIGNVGRFNLQKNHIFLIKIMKELCKIDNENKYKMILVGTGELEDKIKNEIKKNNLEDIVILPGVRNDVNNFYCAFDMLVMPSLFEGLPLTGVEAQISGLRCIFSDSITREVTISNNAFFISLKKDEKEWAKEIVSKKDYIREEFFKVSNTFDLKKCTKEIENKYVELYKGVKNEKRRNV